MNLTDVDFILPPEQPLDLNLGLDGEFGCGFIKSASIAIHTLDFIEGNLIYYVLL
jgi:hypothetical protein